MTEQGFKEPPAMEPQKKHGCFFWGCMTTLIIVAVMVAGLVWVGVQFVKIAKEYTSDTPTKIEQIQFSKEQMAALDAKLSDFAQAVRQDRPATLVLTENEINAKLSSLKEFQAAGITADVHIQGSQIKAAVSIPMPDRFGLKGRYLNGSAKVSAGLQMGRLLVFLEDFEVGGKTVPDVFMKEIRNQNLAEDAMKDPDTAAVIAKLKNITVKDGAVVVEK